MPRSPSETIAINENVDETCGCEIQLCSKRKRCHCQVLSKCASPKFALLFLCLASIAQGFVTSGFLSVIISTLEKRFHLRSTESGIIASSYDVAACLWVMVITYYGAKRRKPQWIGWGVVIMGTGSLIFALPHFIAPEYVLEEQQSDLCNATTIPSKCHSSHLKVYMVYFIIGQVLHGAGGSTLFTLGIVYLDESVPQIQSSVYHGIFYSSGVVGPAFGYLVGGHILKIYARITARIEITEEDPMWIGAWWLGFVLGGITTIILAVPILLFPKQLPGTAQHKVGREAEMHKAGSSMKLAELENSGSNIARVGRNVYYLLRNPTFLFLCLAGTFDNGLVYGLSTFGPKYLESMYKITPTQAATYFGVLAILAGASGQLIGGLIVSRAKLAVKGILRLCMCCAIITFFTIFIFFTTCPNLAFAGATVPYSGESESSLSVHNYTASCNRPCNCSMDVYDPVCGDDNITYYSPCYAGCMSLNENKIYTNCSCIAFNISRASKGKCTKSSCDSLSLFLGVFFFAILGTFLPITPAIQALLRVVPFNERAFAIGVKYVILRVLGSIPAPIVFGEVLDLACAVWSRECGETGFCKLYRNGDLATRLTGLIAVIKVFVISFYIIAYLLYKPLSKEHNDNLESLTLTSALRKSGSGFPLQHANETGVGEMRRNRMSNSYSTVKYSVLKEEEKNEEF